MFFLFVDSEEPVDRLEISYGFEEALDLSEFATSLNSLEGLWEDESPDSRLAVTRVQEGSASIELIPYVLTAGAAAYAMAGGAVTISDFLRKLRRALVAFSEDEGIDIQRHPDDLELEQLSSFIGAVAATPGSDLSVRHVRRRKGEAEGSTIVDFHMSRSELERAHQRISDAVESQNQLLLEAKTREEIETEHFVELYLDQISRDPPKETGRTRDKGVVPNVSSRALPLYFSQESGLKERILTATENPLKTRYIVDVVVTYVGGRPKSYEVTSVRNALLLEAPRR